jgi:perosamine synthetase
MNSEQRPQERKVQIYKSAVRKAFQFLKETERLDHLWAKSIPIEKPEGFLIPVCRLHVNDHDLIATLSKWRSENSFAYPTQFPVTENGTKNWLTTKLLEVEDRILFLILNKTGKKIGHLGFASCINDGGEMEIDNVVRGVKEDSPGMMQAASKALLKWAHDTIGPEEFVLRVFEDNSHAVEFYKKMGFVASEKIPLRKKESGEMISYVPLESSDQNKRPDKIFLRMVYNGKNEDVGKSMILTAGPSVSARESFYAFDAARSGWNSKWSDYLTRFESTFSNYLGVKYSLATSSCTGALHIALAALGIGPGDEVIVPDITWVASANAVLYVGATPIFADIELDSWCLDPSSFESKITERTKAVIPVHLYGHPARMDQIVAIARKHHLYIVEDAAPAIGAEYKEQKAGTFGDFAAFSFQGAKLVVTGEGGMLVTANEELFQKAKRIWDQGRDPSRVFWINEKGLKYKMSNVQAAIGLGQMERVDELIEMKRRLFHWYEEDLQGIPHLQMNREINEARSIYWMSSLVLGENAGISREDFIKELKKNNIDTRPVFPAISQYPIWSKKQTPAPNALRIGNWGLNLPSGGRLTRNEVKYISKCIREILSRFSKHSVRGGL